MIGDEFLNLFLQPALKIGYRHDPSSKAQCGYLTGDYLQDSIAVTNGAQYQYPIIQNHRRLVNEDEIREGSRLALRRRKVEQGRRPPADTGRISLGFESAVRLSTFDFKRLKIVLLPSRINSVVL